MRRMHVIVAAIVLHFLLSTFSLPNHSSCSVPFKVFVYDLPSELLRNAEEARRNQSYHVCKKCIYEQFALEYVIYDYFTQFCGRTYSPEEADYFYLPIIRDIDYRIALASGGNRTPSPIDQALIDIIEKGDMKGWGKVFQVSDKYWKRYNGSDHIIVMPAPVTNLRHQTSRRGYFHYMLQLANPIFINVELSKLFVQEYPICAKKKNIIVPYPTTDSDFYAYNYFPLPLQQSLQHQAVNTHKNHLIDYLTHQQKRFRLIFYQGGNHGSCVKVRQSLTTLSKQPHTKEYFLLKGDRKREEGFLSATFCPIPIGDSPSSKRMYDAMHFGCIPVLLSDEITYAYSTIAGGMVDIHSFAIQLPQRIVYKSIEELIASGITSTDINGNQTLPLGQSVWALFQSILTEQQAQRRLALRDEDTIGELNGQQERKDAESVGKHGKRTTIRERKNRPPRIFDIIQRSEERNAENEPEPIATELDTMTSAVDLSHLVVNKNSTPTETRRILQQEPVKKTKQKPPAIAKEAATNKQNVLIELLKRIAPEEVIELRRNAVRISQEHFLFYSMNDTALIEKQKNTALVQPPLTATHTFPTGGAIHTLEILLTQRKQEGIIKIGEACQKEKNQPGHKYIGQYICDKRRRLQVEEEANMVKDELCQLSNLPTDEIE